MSTPPPITLPAGGTVLGIGCDLIEVERIRGVLERHGERFLHRVFTEEERAYCSQLKYPYKHYAARWAAKEAASKAFTTGIGPWLDWTSISICHGERKEPLAHFDDKARALMAQVGATNVLVSLSHTETHAMAMAVLVRG